MRQAEAVCSAGIIPPPHGYIASEMHGCWDDFEQVHLAGRQAGSEEDRVVPLLIGDASVWYVSSPIFDSAGYPRRD